MGGEDPPPQLPPPITMGGQREANDFFKHDTDGDNAISFAEFQKQMQAIRPNRRDQQKTSKSTTSTTSITSLSNKGGPGMKKR